MTEAIDRATEAVRRWWTWGQVKRWSAPPKKNESERCPQCGGPMEPVTDDVPRYDHDPVDFDATPVLEMRRCGECGRYQKGGLRERAA